MGNTPQPSFETIFDDQLFTEDAAQARPATADIEELFDQTADTSVGSHIDTGGHRPRFDGDTSQLPPEVCWTLQELVAAPHISEDKSRKSWPVLLQYEDQLRSRLSELGLILEINREHGFAFTQQADDPSPHSRTLLRARTLSLAASTLALYLYNQYLLAPEDPVVETNDMIEHMLGYQPAGNTDEAGFRKKIQAAIKSLEEASIIKPVIGTTRYIIYGVITSILSAERVEALNARYKALAAGVTVDAETAGTGTSSAVETDADSHAGTDVGDDRGHDDE
jgi:hypothetical protein